jgi:hypothetical protein
MSTFGNELQAEGHIILLLEPRRNERTYSDYPDLESCLKAIIVMFEESCGVSGDGVLDLERLFRWIDEFYLIKMFSFARDISRYRVKSGAELREYFKTEDDDAGANGPAQNGINHINGNLTNSSLNSVTLNSGANYRTGGAESEDDDSDDEENWDD